MTLQDLINWFSVNQSAILIYFGSLIVLSFILKLLVRPGNIKTLKYIFSLLVYGATVPGILASMLVAYSFFILKTSLLRVSFVTYFAPIIAMILVLLIISSKVKMRVIPGFNRLSSLMTIISITFLIMFVLSKMHFGLFFIGGFSQLVILFIVLFVILKVAFNKLTK